MSESYTEWFRRQPEGVRKASLEHMMNCKRLGEAERRSPLSPEAEGLRRQIAAYYATTGDDK